jgi:autotransporter strand-loop-strand O-heptosyltransferase
MIYNNLEYRAKFNSNNQILIDFIKGAKCEIKGETSTEYQVKFFNHETDKLIHEATISNNMWTSPNYKSFILWRVEVWENSKKIHEHIFNANNKNIFINFDSKSIGDTLAWFPYVEEFRQKHNCKIICSTFHNNWFESKYPEIKFIQPGNSANDLYASYSIGWYYNNYNYNSSIHPNDFKSQPLQKTVTDILGLKFKESIPKIKDLQLSSIKEKYVTISIQSTCQAKYWNHPTGWEQIVKYIQNKGYKVAIVDQHRTFGIANFMNTSPQADYHFHEKSLDEVMSIIKGASFHIGIGSGLSWVAWALKIPTILISSFSKPYCEFQSNTVRIYKDTLSSGYFNTHKMDASDWNWYPFQEINSMEDWYKIETITPDLVIEGIDRIL